ncbi:hypothetical protein BWP39_09430 [Paraburkholderia acidicola]|uniref:Uncharacterized protein n=1 Tax=Paraburkholderia acidicola TaxID=1912599 RepID=A0A2A4F2W3_9BURK|nr:hypothetical protein BWP39_09430 [Paraburkholderia acidicola]
MACLVRLGADDSTGGPRRLLRGRQADRVAVDIALPHRLASGSIEVTGRSRSRQAIANTPIPVDAIRLNPCPRHPATAIESSVRHESVLEIRGAHRNRYCNRNRNRNDRNNRNTRQPDDSAQDASTTICGKTS